jgi:hypothetical protein
LNTFGKPGFANFMQGPRGKHYFALLLKLPGSLPGTFEDSYHRRIVNIENLRLPMLRQATIDAAEAAEKGQLSLEELEKVLDYLFAELNRRMNKNA